MEYVSGETAKINGCIFCEIVKEKDDSVHHVVYRGKHCYAVLNKFPYNNGHVMVIPYMHAEDLLLVPEEVQAECQGLINKTIKALRRVFNPQGINIGLNMGSAAGAGIAEHIHYHILPRWLGDTNFMPVLAGAKVISESLDSTYKKLKEAYK
jgi:ATP adenylyltransferase